MIIPTFTFDAEANGYISSPFQVQGRCQADIVLAQMAPVVILMQEADGGWANNGEPPEQSDHYKIGLNAKEASWVKIASPVEVRKCYII